MSEIKYPAISEILKRRFQADASLLTLSDQLVSTVPLEVDRPEWKYYENSPICHGYHQLIAPPGTDLLHLFLWNPLGSKLLLLVEGIWGNIQRRGATADYRLPSPSVVRFTTDAGTSLHLTPNMRDTRWDSLVGGSKNSVGQIRSIISAGTGTVVGVTMMTALQGRGAGTKDQQGDWQIPFYRPYVIGPGSGFGVRVQEEAGVTDTRLQVSFNWTERRLTPWEEQLTPSG